MCTCCNRFHLQSSPEWLQLFLSFLLLILPSTLSLFLSLRKLRFSVEPRRGDGGGGEVALVVLLLAAEHHEFLARHRVIKRRDRTGGLAPEEHVGDPVVAVRVDLKETVERGAGAGAGDNSARDDHADVGLFRVDPRDVRDPDRAVRHADVERAVVEEREIVLPHRKCLADLNSAPCPDRLRTFARVRALVLGLPVGVGRRRRLALAAVLVADVLGLRLRAARRGARRNGGASAGNAAVARPRADAVLVAVRVRAVRITVAELRLARNTRGLAGGVEALVERRRRNACGSAVVFRQRAYRWVGADRALRVLDVGPVAA